MSEAAKNRRSFSMAYLLAQCAPPLKLPDKQPTAYSYNGVVLPKLPEWDETVYPYAYLFYGLKESISMGWIHPSVYQVVFTEKPMTSMLLNDGRTTYAFREGTSMAIYIVEGGVFVLNRSYNDVLAAWPSDFALLIWANADICDSDGILRRSADSEPVPVYE